MKALYEVTAVKNGFVTHKSYQVASSQEDAIRIAKSYHIPSRSKYDEIRATYLRDY